MCPYKQNYSKHRSYSKSGSRNSALFFFLLFVFFAKMPFMFAQSQTFDYLIKNATVYDGESWKARRVDVGILKDRIVAVGDLQKAKAVHSIDAEGMILAPGFIDAHTHSDFNPVVYPDLPNKILQGVTTEIVGNCGMSAAPILGSHSEHIKGIWAREGVVVKEKISWKSFKSYRKDLERRGLQTNFVALVGHGNLRSAVMGFSPRPASQGEIQQMKKALAQAMSEGAAGISYGLVYLPGMFANEEELVELCRETAKHSGVCAFHIRNEGSKLIEALNEAIAVGEKAGAPIQISHLKAAGKNNWNKIDDAFALIEKKRLEGRDVLADVYPYTASQAELGVILPDELYQREDRVALFKNLLKRDALFEQLRDHFEARGTKWDAIMISSTVNKKYRRFEGMTIKDIARKTKKSPERWLIEALADNAFEISAFSFSQNQDVVDHVVEKDYVTIGSDSVADGTRKTHPRAFGSHAKIFKSYVGEYQTLKWGQAIQKMTSLVARHFKLQGRGEIKENYFADLVLFDPKKIADHSTYENPTVLSTGVHWVFVNGVPVVKEGKPTNAKSGRFLSATSNEQ
jgi:N-acyl-D-amino-acid deacylase